MQKGKVLSERSESKGFVGILVLILVIIAAIGGAYYLKSHPYISPKAVTSSSPAADTSIWKIYTNTKYGFSLKYPPTYVLVDSEPESTCIASSQDKLNDNLSQGVCININPADLYTSYEQASAILIHNYEKENTGEIPQQKIEEPDKITVTKGPYSLPEAKLENVYERTTYWKYKSGAMSAGYRNVNKNEADIYDQILSTFKFTQYSCPETEYVNCMPIVTPEKQHLCDKNYLAWAQANCPTFKGATY